MLNIIIISIREYVDYRVNYYSLNIMKNDYYGNLFEISLDNILYSRHIIIFDTKKKQRGLVVKCTTHAILMRHNSIVTQTNTRVH